MTPVMDRGWKQTLTGRAINLAEPTPAMIDVPHDVAGALARIARFTGHAGSFDGDPGYSVAEHCCLGADAILFETGKAGLALAFLLHDAHEAYCGDIASPVAHTLDQLALALYGPAYAATPRAAIAELKRRLDVAIHARLGLPWPLLAEAAAHVGDMDIRMLKRERDELMGPPPAPWHWRIEQAALIPSLKAIPIWPARRARLEWLSRLVRWHPAAAEGWPDSVLGEIWDFHATGFHHA